MKYTDNDLQRLRQVILDDIIDELTGYFANHKVDGITRMTCKRLAIELNGLRNDGWSAPPKWDLEAARQDAQHLDDIRQKDHE